MVAPVRHLLNRNGRFFARLVIPKEFRSTLGKSELRVPLGPDYRTALKKLPGAIASLQDKIAVVERRNIEDAKLARYPLTVEQIAWRSYYARLVQDDCARNAGPTWASTEIDDGYVSLLRQGIAGKLHDDELRDLVGHRIDYFVKLDHTDAKFGSTEWRILARAMAVSEFEAISRLVERDEGDFTGQPQHALLKNSQPAVDDKAPISLIGLFEAYNASRAIVGKGRGAAKRWKPVFANLRRFLGHDDASRITKSNMKSWRDDRLKTHTPKTVSDVDLAAVRTVFNWAVEEDKLPANPVQDVRQDIPDVVLDREKGFTLPEALVILNAAKAYVPKASATKDSGEKPSLTSAKRWVPFLCAFSGARVSEMTQLRKEDFTDHSGRLVMRIRPSAGTVKAGGYRDVPIHSQLIELGFGHFLTNSKSGPLFYQDRLGRSSVAASQMVSGRISDWLRDSNLIPAGLQPSHAWRHRFKTLSTDCDISTRVTEAIQGHASRTAGDDYGDVTLKARQNAIDRLPNYDLE